MPGRVSSQAPSWAKRMASAAGTYANPSRQLARALDNVLGYVT